jgi:hypothetical protein
VPKLVSKADVQDSIARLSASIDPNVVIDFGLALQPFAGVSERRGGQGPMSPWAHC